MARQFALGPSIKYYQLTMSSGRWRKEFFRFTVRLAWVPYECQPGFEKREIGRSQRRGGDPVLRRWHEGRDRGKCDRGDSRLYRSSEAWPGNCSGKVFKGKADTRAAGTTLRHGRRMRA